MKKTAMMVVQELIKKNYPNENSLQDVIEQAVKAERLQIEAAYNAGQNDPKNIETASKYYFMNYIDND